MDPQAAAIVLARQEALRLIKRRIRDEGRVTLRFSPKERNLANAPSESKRTGTPLTALRNTIDHTGAN